MQGEEVLLRTRNINTNCSLVFDEVSSVLVLYRKCTTETDVRKCDDSIGPPPLLLRLVTDSDLIRPRGKIEKGPHLVKRDDMTMTLHAPRPLSGVS
jgi:hypothetical protein